MDRPVKVKILDDEYLIKSDVDEEQVRFIAEFLDERLREIRRETPGITQRRLVMVAAFHIASEYLQVLHERDRRTHSMGERARSLIREIDMLLNDEGIGSSANMHEEAGRG